MACLFRSTWIREFDQANIDVFDSKGKIKEEHKEEYEKLKEVIDFNSKSLIPLKNFLGQFAENKQKTNLF
ncbi:hypothetical protein [Helicobacter pylori]|uniref:hypothetical protein n=1 Tax=Helicobacter pylori TaxID=210 RepID=UPI00280BB06E|nr:hypothetical protein [Helicobacter pylori]